MNPRRLLPSAGLAAALITAATAAAAPAPQLIDPRGDTQLSAGDILSATFSTTGRTLRVDLAVAGAVSTTTPYSYAVHFAAGLCNFSAIYYGHPAQALGFETSGVGCDSGSSSLPTGVVQVSGSTVSFLLPVTGPLTRGLRLTGIRADTTPSGLLSGALLPVLQDTATTSTTYTIPR